MADWIEELARRFRDESDWFDERDSLLGEAVRLLGFGSLVNLTETKSALWEFAATMPGTALSEKRLLGCEGKANKSEEAVQAVLDGKLLVVPEAETGVCWMLTPVARNLERPVGSPNLENVIRGPAAAFTESVETNIGIARQYLRSAMLKADIVPTGGDSPTRVAILYMAGRADPDFVRKLDENLRTNKIEDVSTLQGVISALGYPKRSLITKLNSTELPSEAACMLRKGKVILFVDRMPYALIMPTLLWDLFALESDQNFPVYIMYGIRALRVIGALLTILLPALYVALVAINPEALRIQLALSVAQSREGVPYPAFLETLTMLLILELILEGSIRLPKSVGPTITMVGGIILGQAVVSAKLVSNLLIIVLAATTIANSTIAGFQNSYAIRVLKYVTLVLSAIFGIIGIFAGFLVICGYLASQSTYGVNYLQFPGWKDEARHE